MSLTLNAVRLSQATFRTIRQDLFWAGSYNVLAIPVAAVGLLNPIIGVIAMTASSLSVVGNSLRLRRADLTTTWPTDATPTPRPTHEEDIMNTLGLLAQTCGRGMHGWDGGWMWLWGTLMMLTWVAVIGGAVWLIVRGTRSGNPPASNARQILDERLARGEIDLDEYQQRRGLLD